MELDGDFYHQECFEGSAVDILLERFGAQKGIEKNNPIERNGTGDQSRAAFFLRLKKNKMSPIRIQ